MTTLTTSPCRPLFIANASAELICCAMAMVCVFIAFRMPTPRQATYGSAHLTPQGWLQTTTKESFPKKTRQWLYFPKETHKTNHISWYVNTWTTRAGGKVNVITMGCNNHLVCNFRGTWSVGRQMMVAGLIALLRGKNENKLLPAEGYCEP